MFFYINATFFLKYTEKVLVIMLAKCSLPSHYFFLPSTQKESLAVDLMLVHLNEEVINTTYQNEQGRNFGSDMIPMRAGDRHKP